MSDYKYDIAVSFAGEDRAVVERFVKAVARAKVRVFYDAWEQAHLWGKDLYQYLDEVYRHAARYCVIFVSEHYVKKAWTSHELRSAQARAFQQNSEYILPIKLDDSELPGLPPTVGYLSIKSMGLTKIAKLLVEKLGLTKAPRDLEADLVSTDPERRVRALNRIAIEQMTEHFDEVVEVLGNDTSELARERAAWALDNLNDERALPGLLGALEDPVLGVRSTAGWALVHLGITVKEAVERVANQSANSDAREMARLVLERL